MLGVEDGEVVYGVYRSEGACGTTPAEFGLLWVLPRGAHAQTVAYAFIAKVIHGALLFGQSVGSHHGNGLFLQDDITDTQRFQKFDVVFHSRNAAGTAAGILNTGTVGVLPPGGRVSEEQLIVSP